MIHRHLTHQELTLAAIDDLIGRGAWWQLGAATGALFFLVLAANVLADALRDILDPRLRGQAMQ